MPKPITRAQILTALKTALKPLPYALALWEGVAASFNRIDEWSDIDLQVAADEDHVAAFFPIVESALAALSPLELKYELLNPHGMGTPRPFITCTMPAHS